MLKTNLLHPQILMSLASCGHGAKILVADGNFSFSTRSHPGTMIVYLNLSPDVLRVTDVINILKDNISVESAKIMMPEDKTHQPIHEEFRKILGTEIPVTPLARQDFYNEVQSNDTCLIIATADRRRFANILITVGVIK